MNVASRILAIGLSLLLVFLIFELVRRKKLKEKYAILWMFTGFTVLTLAVFERLLGWITRFLGIGLPVNAVFFFGIFFIILINLHFSLVISNLSEQNKRIAQKLALLENESRISKQEE